MGELIMFTPFSTEMCNRTAIQGPLQAACVWTWHQNPVRSADQLMLFADFAPRVHQHNLYSETSDAFLFLFSRARCGERLAKLGEPANACCGALFLSCTCFCAS